MPDVVSIGVGGGSIVTTNSDNVSQIKQVLHVCHGNYREKYM